MCYNMDMNLNDSKQVRQALVERLEPVAHASELIAAIENQRPRARKAAVLVCLFEQHGETYLVFIRRASTLRSHSGEIAFPGGGIEPTDASPVDAALREAQEEIGLDTTRAQILGLLPPVFTAVSNYLVVPVVAYLPEGLGDLHLQESEVAELILVPLQGLADPSIVHTEIWSRGGAPHTVYFFDYGPYRIWGATARMLNMLIELLLPS